MKTFHFLLFLLCNSISIAQIVPIEEHECFENYINEIVQESIYKPITFTIYNDLTKNAKPSEKIEVSWTPEKNIKISSMIWEGKNVNYKGYDNEEFIYKDGIFISLPNNKLREHYKKEGNTLTVDSYSHDTLIVRRNFVQNANGKIVRREFVYYTEEGKPGRVVNRESVEEITSDKRVLLRESIVDTLYGGEIIKYLITAEKTIVENKEKNERIILIKSQAVTSLTPPFDAELQVKEVLNEKGQPKEVLFLNEKKRMVVERE